MKSSMGMPSGNPTPVSVLNYIAGGNHPPSALRTQASAGNIASLVSRHDPQDRY